MKVNKTENIGYLEQVLDLYGADSQKWPETDRDGLLALIAQKPEAKQLLAENKAFDRCLDQASEDLASFDLSSLKLSILQQAQGEPQQIGAMGKMQPLVQDETEGHFFLKLAAQVRPVFGDQGLVGLSVLAACLVLGVFIGMNEYFGDIVQQGLQLAFFDEAVMSGDSLEDFLLGTEIL